MHDNGKVLPHWQNRVGFCHTEGSTSTIKADDRFEHPPEPASGVNHTTMEYLHNFQDRTIEAGHTCVLVGMERFRGLSDHALAYRIKATESAIAFA